MGSGLYKNPPEAARKYSGSQTRIPIYHGSNSRERDSNNNSLHRERSSSLSNYNGKIPRVKSNERLALVDEKDYVSSTTISSRQV
jgi:hypothetical protein